MDFILGEGRGDILDDNVGNSRARGEPFGELPAAPDLYRWIPYIPAAVSVK